MNPARLCPRFSSCSVNNCPLDPIYPDAFIHLDDKEQVCPMEKNVRVRIAAQFPPGTLRLDGLKRREYNARKIYEAKPVALRNEMAQRGKAALEKLRRHSNDKTPNL